MLDLLVIHNSCPRDLGRSFIPLVLLSDFSLVERKRRKPAATLTLIIAPYVIVIVMYGLFNLKATSVMQISHQLKKKEKFLSNSKRVKLPRLSEGNYF